MNTNTFKSISLCSAAAVFAVIVSAAALRADYHPGASIGAQEVVDRFNAMNKGKGLIFDTDDGPNGYNFKAKYVSGKEFADVGAYDSKYGVSNKYFKTFCVEPKVATEIGKLEGKLNYVNGKTTTEKTKNSLTVGAAYLYKMYATGQLDNLLVGKNANKMTELLAGSIRYLMGDIDKESSSEKKINWSTSVFLTEMLGLMGDQSYWLTTYNPDGYYDEIGNYMVFVMNVRKSASQDSQDYLYVTEAPIPYDPKPQPPTTTTPEPATMLMFGTGMVGCLVVKAFRKSSKDEI